MEPTLSLCLWTKAGVTELTQAPLSSKTLVHIPLTRAQPKFRGLASGIGHLGSNSGRDCPLILILLCGFGRGGDLALAIPGVHGGMASLTSSAPLPV